MKIWNVGNFLNFDKIQNIKKYAIIVLNRPIHAEKSLVENLWNHAQVRITVDGGTNRWLAWLRQHELEDKLIHPNLITGDLDSCKKASINFFKNSRVVQTIDQDETDFTKSLHVLEPYINDLNLENVIALCETSGRVDHILANFNTLYKNSLKPSLISRPVFILSSNSISWLLVEGQHTIHIPHQLKKLWCAMIPFQPTKITTNGLKWNMTNETMRFGGLVSTSNKYDEKSDTVSISTEHAILWSMGTSKIDDD